MINEFLTDAVLAFFQATTGYRIHRERGVSSQLICRNSEWQLGQSKLTVITLLVVSASASLNETTGMQNIGQNWINDIFWNTMYPLLSWQTQVLILFLAQTSYFSSFQSFNSRYSFCPKLAFILLPSLNAQSLSHRFQISSPKYPLCLAFLLPFSLLSEVSFSLLNSGALCS